MDKYKLLNSFEFIQWYNNWLNNSKNISKIVDQNIESDDIFIIMYLYLYKKMNTKYISEIFNVSRSNIYSKLKKLGITNDRYQSQGVSYELVEKGLILYENGKTLREISKLLNVSKASVNRWVKKYGKIRSNKEINCITLDDIEKCVKAYQSGISLNLSGELIGVSGTTVRRLINERNIHIRNASESQSIRAIEGRQSIRGIRLFLKTKNGEIRADSIYEAARIVQLLSDINVKKVERYNKFILLPNGKRYNPDLFITLNDGTEIVEEVKPFFQKEREDVIFKANAAKEFLLTENIQYRIITEYIIGHENFLLLKNTNIRLYNHNDHIKYERAIKTAICQIRNNI